MVISSNKEEKTALHFCKTNPRSLINTVVLHYHGPIVDQFVRIVYAIRALYILYKRNIVETKLRQLKLLSSVCVKGRRLKLLDNELFRYP